MTYSVTCKQCSMTWSWIIKPEGVEPEDFMCSFCKSELAHMDADDVLQDWLDCLDEQATGDETV